MAENNENTCGPAANAKAAVRFALTKANGDELEVFAVPEVQAIRGAAAAHLSQQASDGKTIPACLIRLLDADTGKLLTDAEDLAQHGAHLRVVVAGPDLYGGGKDLEALVELPCDQKPGFFYYAETFDAVEFLVFMVMREECPRGTPEDPSFEYEYNRDHWKHKEWRELGRSTDYRGGIVDYLRGEVCHASTQQQLTFLYDAFRATYSAEVFDRLRQRLALKEDRCGDPDQAERETVMPQFWSLWESISFVRSLGLELLVPECVSLETEAANVRSLVLQAAEEKMVFGDGYYPWCFYFWRYPPHVVFSIAADLVECVPLRCWSRDDCAKIRKIAEGAENLQRDLSDEEPGPARADYDDMNEHHCHHASFRILIRLAAIHDRIIDELELKKDTDRDADCDASSSGREDGDDMPT
ncbi:unnamed protein product [Amoebophrya sp. A120]|nr:unnamed protein product [Amoebophrya sp. A120]|eukprot:GSA120T00002871001.1